MIEDLTSFRDRFLGRGASAVTVPALDGALKPNNLLEDAEVRWTAPSPDDLVGLTTGVAFSSGSRILRDGSVALELASPVTAMAASTDGSSLAVACEDGSLHMLDAALARARRLGKPLAGVTALSFDGTGDLLACVGSKDQPAREWQRDLMNGGRTGSIWRVDPTSGSQARIASGLAFPYGILPHPEGGYVVSEGWAKRLIHVEAKGSVRAQLLDDLPGFPARISHSSRGGYWLCVFAPRSQLIEFVLREPAYRRAMMEEVDPRYWIAPALSSGTSFREPMQGGALKQMGILKPWAPTRSYGLAIELDRAFQPVRSLHSRAGGRRHGITSALERDGTVWLTSKGSGVVLAVDAAISTGID